MRVFRIAKKAKKETREMGMKKKWTQEEKLAVVLDGLKGRPTKEICREYGISEGQYYKWRDQGFKGLKQGFEDKRSKQYRDQSWEVERNRLVKMIGEQQLIIDIQKKISETF